MTARVLLNSIITFLLVSCTSESFDVLDSTQSQGQEARVQFTYSIEDRSDSMLTRAVLDDDYLSTGSEVGIFALQEKQISDGFYICLNDPRNEWNVENIRLHFKNACYKATNEQTQVGTQIRYMRDFVPSEGVKRGSFPTGENEGLRFYAYYPYQSYVNYNELQHKAPQIPVSGAWTLNHNAEQIDDYLYTEAIHAKASAGIVNLRFKHAMAQVAVFVRTTKNAWKNPLKAPMLFKVSLTTTYQKGTISLGDGSFTPDMNWVSSQYFKTNSVLSGGYECVARFLVFPEAGAEKDESTILGIDFDLAEPLDVLKDEYNTPSTLNVFEMGEETITITKGKVTNVYLTINRIE